MTEIHRKRVLLPTCCSLDISARIKALVAMFKALATRSASRY
jgi:hypothetical protein